MEFKPIITVGRQYGSGGRYVGKMLAERLDIPFYDKELLAEAAKDSGICQEVLETYDEKQERKSFFSIIGGLQGRADAGMYLDMPLNHRIFLAQFDTIRNLRGTGNCVIVGRGADYILRDYEKLVSVFIHADLEIRAKRVAEYEKCSVEKARELILMSDKKRASYYNF